jgi:diadenosine tetraphosphatase ApaH/serine/threonine PP2A family protein phosphatase
MRYGIFSDVHSNLEALSAVISAYKHERIDRYLCIGDIVGYATDCHDCIRLVKDLKARIVAGNHDWGASGQLDLEYFNPSAKEALVWTAKVLSQAESDFLRGLPLAHSEENFILVHATLDSPQEFYYLNNYDEAERTFALLDRQICFVGHTHRPGVFVETQENLFYKPLGKLQLEDKKRYIINVGSVGQPRDADTRAAYVIYDTEAKTVQLERISYNFKITQEKIFQAGLPEFLAARLGEGK